MPPAPEPERAGGPPPADEVRLYIKRLVWLTIAAVVIMLLAVVVAIRWYGGTMDDPVIPAPYPPALQNDAPR